MWRHIQSVRALTNREGVMAVERLLSVTAEADGKRCRLTAIVDAYRRDIPMPTPSEAQWSGLRCHPEPAVNALTAEVLPRAGLPGLTYKRSGTATVSTASGSPAGMSSGPVAVPRD